MIKVIYLVYIYISKHYKGLTTMLHPLIPSTHKEACRAADTHLPTNIHHRLLAILPVPVGQHLPVVQHEVVGFANVEM